MHDFCPVACIIFKNPSASFLMDFFDEFVIACPDFYCCNALMALLSMD